MNSPTVSDLARAAAFDLPEAPPAVEFQDVAVRYRLPAERIASFKEFVIRWLKRQVVHHDFWALRGVSLGVRRGETFGLIGPNGAGKTTLLRVAARILPPTEGRVRVRGRVAPLLELGAGFDPELTGRENVYLNAAILGLARREIEARFERIVDFAEVRDFIDAPLRTYSSGMLARLGFAVATDVEAQVLIVDEVLSVGDEHFQRKSLERIRAFHESGATILIVSHSLEVIEAMCDRAAWLDRGQVRAMGPAADVVRQYRQAVV